MSEAYTPTMRQRYKLAALQGSLAFSGRNGTSYYVKWAGIFADAMIAEDTEHEAKGSSHD